MVASRRTTVYSFSLACKEHGTPKYTLVPEGDQARLAILVFDETWKILKDEVCVYCHPDASSSPTGAGSLMKLRTCTVCCKGIKQRFAINLLAVEDCKESFGCFLSTSFFLHQEHGQVLGIILRPSGVQDPILTVAVRRGSDWEWQQIFFSHFLPYNMIRTFKNHTFAVALAVGTSLKYIVVCSITSWILDLG